MVDSDNQIPGELTLDSSGEGLGVDRVESVAQPCGSNLEGLLVELREQLKTLSLAQKQSQNDSIIKELHSQLQEARVGLHWKILKTVLGDIVRLHDDLGDAASRPIDGADAFRRIILEFRQDVEDLLERNGFSPFTTLEDRFDARRQQSVRTIETADPALVGKVAERLAPGFADESKVLRQEKVTVFMLSAKSRTEASSPAS